MQTKLAVILLSGLSVGLSLSALAVADGDPVGYMDWSYVMGTEAQTKNQAPATKPETNFIKTPASLAMEAKTGAVGKTEKVIAQTVPTETGLTLSYVDEAAPILPVEKTVETPVIVRTEPKKPCAYQKCQAAVLTDPVPVQELHPQTVAHKTIVESQIDTRYVQQPVKVQYPITRQYPISVQYPVTVQREVTVEQPVVMQQPVIVRRPVVMQQAVTVQRPTTYVQQEPMIMQQQPTYIQQQPIVMQVPQQNGMPQGQVQNQPLAQSVHASAQMPTQMPVQQPVVVPTQVPVSGTWTQPMAMPIAEQSVAMPPVTLPSQSISVAQPDLAALTAQISAMPQPQIQTIQSVAQPMNGQAMVPPMPIQQQPVQQIQQPMTAQPVVAPVVPQQGTFVPSAVVQPMPATMPTATQAMPQMVQPVSQEVMQPVSVAQPPAPIGYSYPAY